MDKLEDMVETSEEEYNEIAYNRHDEKVQAYMKKHPSNPPKNRIKKYLSLPKEIIKNATGMTLGKILSDRENKEILENLEGGDEVLLFAPGHYQNNGDVLNLQRLGKKLGKKVYAVSWDYKDFRDGGEKLAKLAEQISLVTGINPIVAGHSDGYKAIKVGDMEFGLGKYTQKYLAIQSDINGMYNSLPGHFALGGLPKSGNLAHKGGLENSIYLNSRRMENPVYSIIPAGNDGLVTQESASEVEATETWDVDATHFDFAGTSNRYNRLTLDRAYNSGWNDFNRNNSGRSFDSLKNESGVSQFTKSKRGKIASHGAWYN
jgi:hypothetical protein